MSLLHDSNKLPAFAYDAWHIGAAAVRKAKGIDG